MLELLQNTCRNFWGSELLAVQFGGPVSSHVTLDRSNRVLDVHDCLALSDFTNQRVTVLVDSHDRWGGASTFSVSNNLGLSTFQDSHY